METEDSARHEPFVPATRTSVSGEASAAAPAGSRRTALSTLLFTDGVLDPQACGDPRIHEILTAAAARAADRLRPGDVLHAVLAGADPAVLAALESALAEGAAPQHLMEAIDVYDPPGSAYGFDGTPERIAPELLAAFADFDTEYAKFAQYAESQPQPTPATQPQPTPATQPQPTPATQPQPTPATQTQTQPHLQEVTLELLLACVLEHPDEQDRRFLGGVLDLARAAEALRQRVRGRLKELPELYDESSGRLRSEEFTADAWAVLEQAAERAAELGYDRLLPPHCLLALLAETEGLAERLLRLQLPPQVGLVKATEIISAAFRISERGRGTPPRLHRDEAGEALYTLLNVSRRTAALWGADRIDTPHLLAALLDDLPPRLAGVLRADPLRLDPDRLRAHVREALQESRSAEPRETAYTLPSFLPPSEDLTCLARNGGIKAACHLDHYFDPLCRALHRSENNHVLITGLRGVGTTTLLRELARRAASGEIPFLRRKRFLRVDCRDVAAEKSAEQLAALVAQVAGRTDLVVCLDGLGGLLRGTHGTDHLLQLRRALKERRLHLVGVLSAHDYDDLVAADHALQELTTRIDVTEPDQDTARDMVRLATDELGEEFGIRAEDHAVARAVLLAGEFIPQQKLPLSAVRVLRRSFEDLHYARTQQGDQRDAVTHAEVVDVVAELSRVPRGQIAGTSEDGIDHEAALTARVVGQKRAVRTVSEELRRIKAGLADASPGPASVLLFAGLTGVGKTELAKAVADLYSASKRLQTYPMENFTEPHSVAGILGSPPGYVGFDRGGRLINELNADPYCVFLLDEAEKAHPEVLRPFLNLFDEGWITDQRGVKAHGDRAIFILTTNAGHEVISRMGPGHTDEESSAAVRERLATVRHRHGELVFTPEFLARIRRIVVFRPLDLEAMHGIGRKILRRRQEWWRERREKELVVPDELLDHAAQLGYRLDRKAEGREGGRVMFRILTDLVENPVLAAAERHPEEFRTCARIEVGFTLPAAGLLDPGIPGTEVRFVPPEPRSGAEESYGPTQNGPGPNEPGAKGPASNGPGELPDRGPDRSA